MNIAVAIPVAWNQPTTSRMIVAICTTQEVSYPAAQQWQALSTPEISNGKKTVYLHRCKSPAWIITLITPGDPISLVDNPGLLACTMLPSDEITGSASIVGICTGSSIRGRVGTHAGFVAIHRSGLQAGPAYRTDVDSTGGRRRALPSRATCNHPGSYGI
jgi:hypothetical protein